MILLIPFWPVRFTTVDLLQLFRQSDRPLFVLIVV